MFGNKIPKLIRTQTLNKKCEINLHFSVKKVDPITFSMVNGDPLVGPSLSVTLIVPIVVLSAA